MKKKIIKFCRYYCSTPEKLSDKIIGAVIILLLSLIAVCLFFKGLALAHAILVYGLGIVFGFLLVEIILKWRHGISIW